MKKPPTHPFESLYNADRPIETLGELYKPCARFEYGKDVLVATIYGSGDGQTVEVYECRMPARFFVVKALPEDGKPGYEISTGSGEEIAELAGTIAKQIAEGMLGFSALPKAKGKK